jgi:putative ABC transport system permease protein
MNRIPGALKIAFRSLARRKFFTFVSLFGIAFTLLVLLVAAAFVDHTIGTHPPESRAGRTLYVTRTRMAGEHSVRNSGAGYGFLDKEVRNLPGAENVSLFTLPESAISYNDGRKVKSQLKRVDGAFWSILDMHFLEGAAFTEDDDRNAREVAVINAFTRNLFFGGGPAVGKTIEIAGQRLKVVGVVEDVSLMRVMIGADVYAPIGSIPGEAWRHEAQGNFGALILARSAGDFDALRTELHSRVKRFPIPDPKTFTSFDAPADTMFGVAARGVVGELQEDPHAPGLSASAKLAFLMAAAALLFMTLPAINLINVNLSRVLERAPEIGVRRAFGATRSRLVVQFVVENLALTLIGGVIAAVLAAAVLAAINASGVIPYAQLGVNLRVLSWGLLASVVFGLLSGVVPAWRMSRLHPVEALRGRAS